MVERFCSAKFHEAVQSGGNGSGALSSRWSCGVLRWDGPCRAVCAAHPSEPTRNLDCRPGYSDGEGFLGCSCRDDGEWKDPACRWPGVEGRRQPGPNLVL